MNKVSALSAALSVMLASGTIMTVNSGIPKTPPAAAIVDDEFASIMARNPETPGTLPGARVVNDKFVRANYQKMKVYDTRRKGEYLESHIPGALSAPYKEKSSNSAVFDFSKDSFDESKYPSDKDTPVILYCNGVRCWSCYKTAFMLIRSGYTNIHWYRNNGFPGWKSKNYPVEIEGKGTGSNITIAEIPEFVFVKGGCFMMGDNFGDGDNDERPAHKVCVEDFFIGKHEITRGQWKKVIGPDSSGSPFDDNHPIVNISWQESQQFIEKLNKITGEMYRLPTEAEWEYAAVSSGKKSKYATVTGDISHDLCNYDGTAGKDKWIKFPLLEVLILIHLAYMIYAAMSGSG
jgi:formylglycine-generating enzyme required for sulfatase activity